VSIQSIEPERCTPCWQFLWILVMGLWTRSYPGKQRQQIKPPLSIWHPEWCRNTQAWGKAHWKLRNSGCHFDSRYFLKISVSFTTGTIPHNCFWMEFRISFALLCSVLNWRFAVDPSLSGAVIKGHIYSNFQQEFTLVGLWRWCAYRFKGLKVMQMKNLEGLRKALKDQGITWNFKYFMSSCLNRCLKALLIESYSSSNKWLES